MRGRFVGAMPRLSRRHHMTKCWYCQKAGVEHGALSHPDCEREYRRRLKQNKCVKCGNDSLESSIYCGTCGGNARFVKYPDHSA